MTIPADHIDTRMLWTVKLNELQLIGISFCTTERPAWRIWMLQLSFVVCLRMSNSAMSYFIEAAKNGNMAMTRNYIHAGIDVNCKSEYDGTTALYWAACAGHVGICRLLLENGADVNDNSNLGLYRPLHAAADRGNTECAFLLLRSGADVNMTSTGQNDTALHKAAYRGHYAMCRLLLDHGADTSITNKDGKTPLQEAQLNRHHTLYHLIYEHEQEGRKTSRRSAVISKHQTTDLLPGVDRHPDYHKANITLPVLTQSSAKQTETESTCQNFSDAKKTTFHDQTYLNPYSESDFISSDVKGDVVSNSTKPAETNSDAIKLDIVVEKLRRLEVYTEKLQVLLVKYQNKLTIVQKENDQLPALFTTLSELEKQLQQTKYEVKVQYNRTELSEIEVHRLRRQIHLMEQRYDQLKAEYSRLTGYITALSQNGADVFGHSETGHHLSTLLSAPTDIETGEYDADVDSMLTNDNRMSYVGRGFPGESSTESDASTSTEDSPSQPNGSPMSSQAYDEHVSEVLDDYAETSTERDDVVRTSLDLPQLNTEADPDSSPDILLQAISPVFNTTSQPFLDTLSLSLLQQVNNTKLSFSGHLDIPGRVWRDTNQYYLSDPGHVSVKSFGDKNQFKLLTSLIIHKNIKYYLKMYGLPGELEIYYSSITSLPLTRNLSLPLHMYTLEQRSAEYTMTTFRSYQCIGCLVYPTMSSSLVDFLQSSKKKTSSTPVFPERFIMHQLYGLLTALCILHENNSTYCPITLDNIALSKDLMPVFTGTELEKILASSTYEATTAVPQYVCKDVMPPDVDPGACRGKESLTSTTGSISDILRSSDIYMLACLIIHMLAISWKVISPAEGLIQYRDGIFIRPHWFGRISEQLQEILVDMLSWKSIDRISANNAKMRLGITMYGPRKEEVRSPRDCQVWHQSRLMKLLLDTPRHKIRYTDSCSEFARTVKSSVLHNDLVLEQDFISWLSVNSLWDTVRGQCMTT